MLAESVISLFILNMGLVSACVEGPFLELGIDGSIESVGRLVDSQKKLFYSQIDHLHKVVNTHCKLTGVNPLSQEMAAGALSIKIGKKPRDLLNPKAVKYMQSVFSIKDNIGKKETREISALSGVTSTQVREFFAGQRSKVRKVVRLAREKASQLDESEETNDGCSVNPDAAPSCRSDALLTTVGIMNVGELAQFPSIDGSLPVAQCDAHVHVSSVDAKLVQEVSSSPIQEETLPGIDEDDKKFLENIFFLMRKEGTFSGQVKLMEWILQIQNSALLVWFSTKGSITILSTWLSQAAIEEQTTSLNVILKVLCHLPLHKALPAEISSILQTVNKLRFYRTADIAGRAKILLSKWSKMLVRNQAQKHPPMLNPRNGLQKEIIRKQRINEILRDDFWRSKIDGDDILALTENSGNVSKPYSRHASKLLTASCDSSDRKQSRSSSAKVKERRKVRLVEQLDEKAAARTAQVARVGPSSQSRPMSADDIMKAKIRAMFYRPRHANPDASSVENKDIEQNNDQKSAARDAQVGGPAPSSQSRPMSADDFMKARMRAMFFRPGRGKPEASSVENKKIEQNQEITIPQPNKVSPATGIMQQEEICRSGEQDMESPALPVCPETPAISKLTEAPLEKLRSIQIQWLTPLEMRIDCSWRVGNAESSKELVVQAQRIRREKEIFYSSTFEIPPNPREPWDIEMDFDDSLTPEIPIEQPPDNDAFEEYSDDHVDEQAVPENSIDHGEPALPIASSCDAAAPVPILPIFSSYNAAATVALPALPIASSCIEAAHVAVSPLPVTSPGNGAEPDLELLAVLLKNPELVFALTSGQGKNLTNNERVALLDLIKHSNVGLTGAANSVSGSSFAQPVDGIPNSLPSPTPPSDTERTTGWRSAFPNMANVPLLQPQLAAAALHSFPTQIHSPPPTVALQSGKMPQVAITANTAPQNGASRSSFTHFVPSIYAVDQRLNAESLLLKTYAVSNSPAPATFRQDSHFLNHPSLPTLSSLPSFPPTHHKNPQPLMITEPSAVVFPPDPISWTRRDKNVEWRDEMPESSTHRLNTVELTIHNPRFAVCGSTHHDLYPRHQGQPSSTSREGVMCRSWSPESSPVRPSEFRHGHGRSYTGSRREQGWNKRQGRSRRRPGRHDQYRSSGGGSGRWRERDRDKRR